jgi:hypothetical protein
VKALIDAGANKDAVNNEGNTPLHAARALYGDDVAGQCMCARCVRARIVVTGRLNRNRACSCVGGCGRRQLVQELRWQLATRLECVDALFVSFVTACICVTTTTGRLPAPPCGAYFVAPLRPLVLVR